MSLLGRILGFVAGLSSVSAFSADCDGPAFPLAKVIQSALRVDTPWLPVSMKENRIVIANAEAHQLLLLGYGVEEASAVGALACGAVLPDAYLLADFKGSRAKNGWFLGADESAQAEEWKVFSTKVSAPFLALFVPYDADLKSAADFLKQPPDVFAAFVALHENFHLLHQRAWKTYYQRTDHYFPAAALAKSSEECAQDADWVAAFHSELADWKSLVENEAPPIPELKAVMRRILERRCNQGAPSDCWDLSGEAREGLPNFFAAEVLERAGQLTRLQTKAIIATYLEDSSGKPSAHYSAYGTGHLMAWALDRLDSSKKWQSQVEKGYSLADLLAELVQDGALCKKAARVEPARPSQETK